MSTSLKILRILAGTVVVVILVFGLRYALVDGLISPIDPVTPGACRPVAQSVKGISDLAIDTTQGLIFAAASDGIYAIKRDDPNGKPVKLSGVPSWFHPVALSLGRDPDGSLSLMAIDALAGSRYAVEIYGLTYDGGTPKLSQRSMVQGGLLVSPFGIAALGSNAFYVGNDHVTTSAIGRFAEKYLLWPHDDLLLFNGQRMRIAVQRIASPHGAALSPDGKFLYISTFNDRRVIALGVEPYSGNLTELGAISLPARLNRMRFDDEGALIVAGQTKPGSAQVFRVTLNKDGTPQAYDTLFSDDGSGLHGAVSALRSGGKLFVAGTDKLLECAAK
jgi:hypothetical protein